MKIFTRICLALALVVGGGSLALADPVVPTNIPTTLPIPIDSYVTQFSLLFAVSFAALIGLAFVWQIVKLIRRKAMGVMSRVS